MLIRSFNKTWEAERALIEQQLVSKLTEQINELKKSLRASGYIDDDTRLSLTKMHNELVLRRSLAVYESEEIARARMQLRSSYLAVVMSSLALIISVATFLSKL